jgi:hypothetical protein
MGLSANGDMTDHFHTNKKPASWPDLAGVGLRGF